MGVGLSSLYILDLLDAERLSAAIGLYTRHLDVESKYYILCIYERSSFVFADGEFYNLCKTSFGRLFFSKKFLKSR